MALHHGLNRITRDISTNELELAKLEANSVLELLFDKLDLISRDPYDFNGPKAQAIVAGFSTIVSNAQASLEAERPCSCPCNIPWLCW